MLRNPVFINNEGLLLEASLDLPENMSGICPGVVLCHPHPAYGGDMHNNVIMALSAVLTGMGIACLRFNYRGVGRSKGFFSGGEAELTDGWAALSFLLEREEIDRDRIGIFGYSYGGTIALPLADENDWIKAIAAISPVVPHGALTGCPRPKIIILGDSDTLVPTEQMLRRSQRMSEPKIIKVYPGMDHFWWGYEEEAAIVIGEFMLENFK